LWIGVIAVAATQAWAAELPPQYVADAAQTYVRYVTADARPDAVVESVEPYASGGRTVAYIVHLAGGGFCISGADDRVLPAYVYNPVREFDPTNPSYQFVLQDIARRLDRLDARTPLPPEYARVLDERLLMWDQLVRGEAPPPPAGGRPGDPMLLTLPLTARWHQGSPYNDFCPVLTPGTDEHVVVGCVATAMAQVMYYWKWPPSGSGSDSVAFEYDYSDGGIWWMQPLAGNPNIPANWPWTGRLRWVPDDGGKLEMNGWWEDSVYEEAIEISDDPDYIWALFDLEQYMTDASTSCVANFGAATYNWSIMRDSATDPPDAGALEAAEVSYHAAVAHHMNFGIFGSSAFLSNVPYWTRFLYDPDARFSQPVDAYVVDDIQWSRVAEIAGHDDTGGHAWVIAGYNKNTTPWQYLMNMGWGGGSTDWYARDEIFPSDQEIVTRISPADVVRFVDLGTFGGDGSPDNPYHGLNHALNYAPNDTTLIMKVGTTHTLTGSPAVLDRPMTLKGIDVWIESTP
jgi:hypothetical protein